MQLNRFAKFAWFAVGYNILVILWGAYVRASSSGAGCGSHWPLCNGEIVPLNPSTARLIEFIHRTMSGIDLPLLLVLGFFAIRLFPWGRVRFMALAAIFFIGTEALLGAQLVTAGLVGDNAAPERAFWVGLHLVNTFLLLAALTLTAWWASGGKALRLQVNARTVLLGLGIIGVVLVGTSGTITALGDTLFPSTSLAQGFSQDLNPTANFLIQLRLIHPIIAVTVGAYLLILTVWLTGNEGAPMRKLASALRILVVVQLLAGATNVLLLAPTWMQIVHLFIADLVWIALLLYSASILAAETEPAPETSSTRGALGAPAQ